MSNNLKGRWHPYIQYDSKEGCFRDLNNDEGVVSDWQQSPEALAFLEMCIRLGLHPWRDDVNKDVRVNLRSLAIAFESAMYAKHGEADDLRKALRTLEPGSR